VATHQQRVERIGRLVAHSSVSSPNPDCDQSNSKVTAELADMLSHAGFAVEVLPLSHAPHKHNLIATFGKGEGGLVLAGHTDTVPYDGNLWTSDPHQLTEREGLLYGLGTSDMKAFLALAVEAVEGLSADSLRAPLIVVSTADEETTMDGARALVMLQRPKGRFAIIGEPTDLRPVRAHKGILMERIKVIGRSGHSSNPAYGNNALDGMSKVLVALHVLRSELKERFFHPGFEVPAPTLNFGRIHGGDSPNRICGQCELDIDVRFLPGMDAVELRRELLAAAQEAVAGLGLTLSMEALVMGTAPHELAQDSLLVRAAEQLTGEGVSSVAFATEAPYFADLGTDTLVMGPGGVDVAHSANEYVRTDRLAPTVKVLQAMTHRLCKDLRP
jgi:acetylornithine deacetylase